MTRPLLLQQKFSLLVTKPGQKGSRIDLTDDVEEATLEIDQDRITVLTFILRNPDKHSSYMDSEYHIDFYGGYIDRDTYSNKNNDSQGNFILDTKSSDKFKPLFSGRVFQITLKYSQSSEYLYVTAKDMTWGVTSIKSPYYAYPSTDSSRSFANKSSISLRSIIEGICDDIGIKYKLILSPAQESIQYTYQKSAIQNGITDWAFMRKLAKSSGCYIWTDLDPDSGEYTLFFADKSKTIGTDNPDRIEFLWLGRKDNYDFREGSYLIDGNSSTELSKLKINQIQLDEIDVDVNQQLAGTNITQVTSFDEDTGTQKTVLVSYIEEADKIIYYELDTELVESLARNNPEEADRIRNMGAFDIPFEEFIPYYKKIEQPRGIIEALDEPFYGINITAKCVGDVNIQPFQSYAIYGISKWSTRKSVRVLRYYMNSIKHSWGSDGFTTEMTFKA